MLNDHGARIESTKKLTKKVMKARSKELLDRAVAATVAAIEIYNKPDFLYREEAFAVLAINGWELLLKAKWLADHQNKVSSLYVMEPRTKRDGTKSRKFQIKLTASHNPFTHSLDFLAENGPSESSK